MSQPATTIETPAAAEPFMKWVGGKRQILTDIRMHVPPTFGRYFEPFLGGGAVFFDLHATGKVRQRCYLGDANRELVNAYEVVRDDTDKLVAALRDHAREHSRDHYYAVRSTRCATAVKDAAKTIYLNRTCYNGVYRVNKAGGFNVPIGRYTNPTICDEPNLRACAETLRNAELVAGDFATVLAYAREGDFCYLDPPYVPVSGTSDFTSFTAARFTMADQERLAACARRLKESGVHVLLSNADLPVVRELYAGFGLRRVEAKRAINSKGGKRGAVGELLIW